MGSQNPFIFDVQMIWQGQIVLHPPSPEVADHQFCTCIFIRGFSTALTHLSWATPFTCVRTHSFMVLTVSNSVYPWATHAFGLRGCSALCQPGNETKAFVQVAKGKQTCFALLLLFPIPKSLTKHPKQLTKWPKYLMRLKKFGQKKSTKPPKL